MKNINIISLQYTETQTVITYQSFDDSVDRDQPDLYAWTVDGNINPDAALEYAKTMVDSDVSVLLNLI